MLMSASLSTPLYGTKTFIDFGFNFSSFGFGRRSLETRPAKIPLSANPTPCSASELWNYHKPLLSCLLTPALTPMCAAGPPRPEFSYCESLLSADLTHLPGSPPCRPSSEPVPPGRGSPPAGRYRSRTESRRRPAERGSGPQPVRGRSWR